MFVLDMSVMYESAAGCCLSAVEQVKLGFVSEKFSQIGCSSLWSVKGRSVPLKFQTDYQRKASVTFKCSELLNTSDFVVPHESPLLSNAYPALAFTVFR